MTKLRIQAQADIPEEPGTAVPPIISIMEKLIDALDNWNQSFYDLERQIAPEEQLGPDMDKLKETVDVLRTEADSIVREWYTTP